MIVRIEPSDQALGSVLGRVSPLTKLGVAVGWLIGMAMTTAIVPPLLLAAFAGAAGVAAGQLRLLAIVRGAAPLWVAAFFVGLFNALFAAANVDPAAVEVVRIGPLRLTEAGLLGGVGLSARIIAIGVVGVVFAQTTDSTRLVDSLVQGAGLPARFGYGALAAYQAVPRFAEDLSTLRQARRIRGLRGSWHPRLLVSLLILAIRHGDRLALAMDARGFAAGRPRSRYRIERWSWLDGAIVVAGAALLILALAVR